MTRLDDVINRVRSGDKSVFTDTSTQITGQAQKQTAQTPQLTGSRLDQIIARVKSGDKSVFSDTTTNYVKPVQKQTPDLFGWERDKKNQNFIDRYGQRNTDVEDTLAKVDTAFIQQYMTDVQKYAQNANSQSAGVTSDTMEAFLEKNLHDTYDLKVRGEAIRKYLEQNPNAYGDKYQSLMDYVTSSNDGITQYRKSLNQAEDEILAQKRAQDPTWFQTDNPNGANFWQRAGATMADVGEEIGEGAMEVGEKVVDFGAMVAGTVGGWFGADDFRKKTDEFVAKDLYDSEKLIKEAGKYIGYSGLLNLMGVETESASILGEKSEGLANSAGQLALTAGMAPVVPWWVTSGATSFGAEAENALNQGATHEEAMWSASISAASEILTEKLFGGSGLGEKGLINTNALTKGISNKLLQTLAKYGVDMASEGLEEAASELAGNLASALYKEENLEELLASEEALQSYLDAFVGGAVMSGTMNFGRTVSDVASIIHANQNAQKLYGTDPGALITESLEIDPNNAYAQKMQDRLNKGKRITGNQLNQMVQKNEAALKAKDLQAIQDAAQNRLEALGEPEGAKAIAEAIAKKTAGQELSGADELLIHSSKYAQRVLNELNAENIRSGDYASDWTGNINTERVNTDVYNRNAPQSVDTTTQRDYDNINNQGGTNYGKRLQQNDRAGSIGNPAQGMAGVQYNDGNDIERGRQSGEVAVDSGVVRVSPELADAQKKRGTPVYPVDAKQNSNIPETAVGAAPEGFDPLSSAMYKYGKIPEGENPTRAVDLPVSMDGKSQVSRTARTVAEAKATTDKFAELIGKEVAKGGLSYIPIKNSETTQKAVEYIQRVGWDAALEGWSKDVHAGKTGADMSAIGALLLNNASNAGDRNTWLNVLHDYQIMGTYTAQGLQALRILKQLTPSDKLYMIERSAKQLVEDLHLDTKITISKELQQEYDNAKTDEARDKVLNKIQKDIASQIPSTTLDKWTALRYVNMLGNLRTQIRNIVGNAGMKLVSAAKNAVAVGIENLAYKASGGKLERTKSLTVSKAQMDSAKADFDNVKFAVLNGGKYADSGTQAAELMQAIQDRRTIFKSDNKILNVAMKPIEGYRKVTNWAMQTGDLLFSKPAYARALAGYLKANGVTGSDYTGVDTAIMDDARLYAIKEAQEQTFRDTNWLSGWISKVGRRKDTPKAVKAISEGIMPFRKTPANVLVRAEEYSPLGIINSVYYSVKSAQKGSDITGAQVINSWAKTITGTGIFGLGMLLYNLGMLSTGDDEDEKKESFDSMNGWQNYALILPDGTNLTIDFLTPEAMPLLMGAELMKMMQEGGISAKDIEKALTSIADPMIQMSMLQGVNDTLDNIQYAEDNLGQLLINASVSYLTQGLTNTLAGQIERSFEDSRMQTFVDKDSDLPSWLQRTLGKASAKIPGWDYQQVPYINAWGEEEKNPGLLANLAYNTLSPSYIEMGQDTPLTRELERLNKAVPDTNTYPSVPDKTLSYTDTDGDKHSDYVLTSDEWTALARKQGQTQKRIVEDLISSDAYKDLPDEYKAEAIKRAYTYAKEKARLEVIKDYTVSNANAWTQRTDDPVNDILLKAATDSIVDGLTPQSGYESVRTVQKVEAITAADDLLTAQEQADALRDILSDGFGERYDKVIAMGYDNDDFAKVYSIYTQAQDSKDIDKGDALKMIMRELNITKSQARKLYDAYTAPKDKLK